MAKLYVKTLSIVILLVFLIILSYHFIFSYMTRYNFNNINRLLSKGTLSYIQGQLANAPYSTWKNTLNKIQPPAGPPIEILSMNQLKLSEKNNSQLLNGDVIYTSETKFQFIYFLYYGIFENFALQRIGQTPYVLKIMLTEPIN